MEASAGERHPVLRALLQEKDPQQESEVQGKEVPIFDVGVGGVADVAGFFVSSGSKAAASFAVRGQTQSPFWSLTRAYCVPKVMPNMKWRRRQ